MYVRGTSGWGVCVHLDNSCSLYFRNKELALMTSVGLLVLTFCVILSEITNVVRRGDVLVNLSCSRG